MQVTTWIDRITDESTLWLNAVRSEEQHELLRAATLYLRDASVSLGENKPVWAALSCACAADCLGKIGLPSYARLLHRESGRIYLEKADGAALTSVRQMLWSLRQSCQQFMLAGEVDMADEAYRRMAAVSRRVDPFGVDSPMELPQETATASDNDNLDDETYRGSEIVAELERFLRSRETGDYDTAASITRNSPPPKNRKAKQNEKGIINQLG